MLHWFESVYDFYVSFVLNITFFFKKSFFVNLYVICTWLKEIMYIAKKTNAENRDGRKVVIKCTKPSGHILFVKQNGCQTQPACVTDRMVPIGKHTVGIYMHDMSFFYNICIYIYIHIYIDIYKI